MLGTLREVIFPRSTNEVEITFLIFSQGGGGEGGGCWWCVLLTHLSRGSPIFSFSQRYVLAVALLEVRAFAIKLGKSEPQIEVTVSVTDWEQQRGCVILKARHLQFSPGCHWEVSFAY